MLIADPDDPRLPDFGPVQVRQIPLTFDLIVNYVVPASTAPLLGSISLNVTAQDPSSRNPSVDHPQGQQFFNVIDVVQGTYTLVLISLIGEHTYTRTKQCKIKII